MPKISREEGVTDRSQYPEAFNPDAVPPVEANADEGGTVPADPNAVQVRDPDRDHSPENTRSADLRYQADGTYSEAGSSDVTGEPLGDQAVEYPEGYEPEVEPDPTELPKSDAKKAEWRAYLDRNASDEYDPEELDAMTRDDLAQAARDWKQYQDELDAEESEGTPEDEG